LAPHRFTPRFESLLMGHHASWFNPTIFNFVQWPSSQFG
jgi:hypothetical protein